MESLGFPHHPQSLPAAFRVGKAEAALGLFLQVASLLMPKNHDRLAVDAGHAALDGAIVAVAPVAAKLEVVVADELEVVVGVRPVAMARYLHSLPGRQTPRRSGGCALRAAAPGHAS